MKNGNNKNGNGKKNNPFEIAFLLLANVLPMFVPFQESEFVGFKYINPHENEVSKPPYSQQEEVKDVYFDGQDDAGEDKRDTVIEFTGREQQIPQVKKSSDPPNPEKMLILFTKFMELYKQKDTKGLEQIVGEVLSYTNSVHSIIYKKLNNYHKLISFARKNGGIIDVKNISQLPAKESSLDVGCSKVECGNRKILPLFNKGGDNLITAAYLVNKKNESKASDIRKAYNRISAIALTAPAIINPYSKKTPVYIPNPEELIKSFFSIRRIELPRDIEEYGR